MNKSRFYCQNCGNETPKWQGKCPGCKEWNSIVEELKQNNRDFLAVTVDFGDINQDCQISFDDFKLLHFNTSPRFLL